MEYNKNLELLDCRGRVYEAVMETIGRCVEVYDTDDMRKDYAESLINAVETLMGIVERGVKDGVQ